MMNLMAFGVRLHDSRKQAGISSNELANRCGVGPVHIRKIEAGTKGPSIETFVKLCNALKTSPQYLLQDSLEENDLTAQIEALDKISLLSESQVKLVTNIIDTILEQK